MSENNIKNLNNEISLNELFDIFLRKKLLILSITSFSLLLSIIISLSLPNFYTSSILLAPSDQNESLSNKLGGFSAIAGIAGVSLPGESATPSIEAIERIKSFNFFNEYIIPNIKKENILAVEKWIPIENTLIYNKKDFDEFNNRWVRDVGYPKTKIPSNQELYKEFNDLISISVNSKTQFVSISIQHQSPYIAKKWLDVIIININESMREEEKQISANSIDFLNNKALETNLVELKESISRLLENQMQKLMLASANKNYVFKVIDSPIVSEEKSSPNRALIVLIGGMFGAMISVLTSLLMYYRNKNIY